MGYGDLSDPTHSHDLYSSEHTDMSDYGGLYSNTDHTHFQTSSQSGFSDPEHQHMQQEVVDTIEHRIEHTQAGIHKAQIELEGDGNMSSMFQQDIDRANHLEDRNERRIDIGLKPIDDHGERMMGFSSSIMQRNENLDAMKAQFQIEKLESELNHERAELDYYQHLDAGSFNQDLVNRVLSESNSVT